MPENLARLSEFVPAEAGAKWFSDRGITRAWVYSIPLHLKFRGITSRDGLILEGSAGLSEAAPFWNYEPDVALRWFLGAIDVATHGLPATLQPVALNVTVPITDPETAGRIVAESGCQTAKVKVANPRAGLEEDLARLRAVRGALGEEGQIRVDANAAWSLSEALEAVPQLHQAAGRLEYAEQPCADWRDLRVLQEKTGIAIAADESIRLSSCPEQAIREAQAAGLAMVLKAMPLAGPARVIDLFRGVEGGVSGLPKVVVSSALDSGVGLLAGMSLATALGVQSACGLGTGRLMRGGILVEEPRIEEGRLLPPEKIELNEDLPPLDSEITERWRSRVETIARLALNH